MRMIGCGALRHLSLSTRLKKRLVSEGGLGPIFDGALRGVRDMDGALMAQCAATLANVAEDREVGPCIPRQANTGRNSPGWPRVERPRPALTVFLTKPSP
jgi:hypothetical protein